MKATIEISDLVFNDAAVFAQRQGKTVDEYVQDAVCDKLAKEQKPSRGLMSVFGSGDHEAVAEVQRIVDEEFSKVNLDDWK